MQLYTRLKYADTCFVLFQVQTKIHEELDRVVGKTIQPNLSHKSNMKYLQATVFESFRITSSAPFGAGINGYRPIHTMLS